MDMEFLSADASVAEPAAARIHRMHNAARFTAIAGIAYAVLFLVSFWLLTGVPRGDATQQEVMDYYESESTTVINLVALYLMPFSGIAFLWFIVTLRMWISNRVVHPVSTLFSNIQLVSGIVYLSLLFGAAAALSVTAIAVDRGIESENVLTGLEFQQFGGSLFFVFSSRMGAMFVFTTTNIGRAHKIFPTWFVVIGLVVGFSMLLTASFNRALIVVFPLWVATVCILILLHARKRADQLIASIDVDHANVGTPKPAASVPPDSAGTRGTAGEGP